jgi:hypothetical protein
METTPSPSQQLRTLSANLLAMLDDPDGLRHREVVRGFAGPLSKLIDVVLATEPPDKAEPKTNGVAGSPGPDATTGAVA